MNTRRENLMLIVKAPVAIVFIVLMIVWMMLTTVLVLLPLIILTLGPAIILWFFSVFVGLVSPEAGYLMTVPMEWAGGVLEAVIDFLWGKPVDLMEAIL